jgi:two-component system, sensor histidine kinase
MTAPPHANTPVPAPVMAGQKTQGIEAQVLAAQSAMVMQRARPSNCVTSLVGLLVVWILWAEIDHTLLMVWWVVLTLISASREWLCLRCARDEPANATRWARRHEAALLANGVVYGLIGTLLMPRDDPATQAIMLATLAGIASVSLVVLSTSFRAALAMTLPILLPTIITQLGEGTRLSSYVAVAMGIMLVLVVLEGRQASAHTQAMLRVRFSMDDMAAQRQQALDLAQRSSAVKSQFLATMSHEMRTPLHGMLGVTRLLRSVPPGDAAASHAHRLEMIERTGEHLLGLINDVLDYSRIEGGHLRLEPVDFDLAALLESVADLARISAAEKGLTLVLALGVPSPCWVRSDPSRLRQVLLNLTGNAVKFTERGAVHVSVRRAATGATTIDVTDTGPGVAADQHELIFDAFHQTDGSFGRKHGGTGLGLTISRELARALGGDLVCTDAPAGGARFVLGLPLPPGAAVAAPAAAPEAALALRGRVLVAEDNPVNAIVTEALLHRAGLSVDLVADGAQAVACAASMHYDLILMDCQMPGMDGFEATARIRAAERASGASAVPIVALTANALESDRLRSLAAGMNEHLAKPFHDQALNAMLQRFLNSGRPLNHPRGSAVTRG